MSNDTYTIVRMYMHRSKRTIKRGLTLEQAQAHCADPETSSGTCKLGRNKTRTKLYGPWFDSYERER